MSVTNTLKRFRVTISGKPPGLIQQGKGRMAKEAEDKAGGKGSKKSAGMTHEAEAELLAHWTTVKGKKQLALPWVALYKAISKAASDFKYKGQKTMGTLIAATISCDLDMIPLGTSDYEVYVEWVRIPPRTGAMVQIGRPRLREWTATFTLIVDAEMYANVGVLREVIEHAGKLVGIGAWRPELKGPYGRFTVDEFTAI